jgi:hypothetical protein
VSNPEVVFVYLGNSFPNYAIASLKLAVENNGMAVRMIGNHGLKKKADINGVEFTTIENFYNPDEFKKVEQKVLLPHNFRQGFWLKTLERFFVIQQYMSTYGISQIFHAELDQLLFGCSNLVEKIESSKKVGIFVPFHTVNLAVASIFYCNDIEALDSLLDYSKKEMNLNNEMSLIAMWAKSNPSRIFALPTLSTVINGSKVFSQHGISTLTPEQVGGIVDAAQLGQWVGGEDPRNIPITIMPTNQYHEAENLEIVSKDQLSKSQLSLQKNGYVTISTESAESIRVYNLHIHSKIHSWIWRSDDNLRQLIAKSNQNLPVRLCAARKLQFKYFISTALFSFLENPLHVISRRGKNLFRKIKGYKL